VLLDGLDPVFPANLVNVNGTLFFATINNTYTGNKLWKSDALPRERQW